MKDGAPVPLKNFQWAALFANMQVPTSNMFQIFLCLTRSLGEKDPIWLTNMFLVVGWFNQQLGVLLLHPVRQLPMPGEVLPDAEAESLGSGRDAWLGSWELMMVPTNQRSRWIFYKRMRDAKKICLHRWWRLYKPQSRHLDLSHAIVSSNYWRCEMMCSCLDGQASAWSI